VLGVDFGNSSLRRVYVDYYFYVGAQFLMSCVGGFAHSCVTLRENSNNRRLGYLCGGVEFLDRRTSLPGGRTVLVVLSGVDGAVHLAGSPIVLGEYWLLQELYSGFASTHLGVLMFGVPLLLIFGVLFLVTALLVWRGRGASFWRLCSILFSSERSARDFEHDTELDISCFRRGWRLVQPSYN